MVLELKEYTMASLGYKSSENPLIHLTKRSLIPPPFLKTRQTPPFLHLLHFLTFDFTPSLADRRRAVAPAPPPPPPPSNHSSSITFYFVLLPSLLFFLRFLFFRRTQSAAAAAAAWFPAADVRLEARPAMFGGVFRQVRRRPTAGDTLFSHL